MSPIPSTVSQAAARAFKLLARPYEELAQSLKVPDAIQNCLQTHNSVFTEDKNLGLISQAVKQQEMTRIAALGETYLAISVEDVARKLYGSKSAEELAEDLPRLEYLVLQMVHTTKRILSRLILDWPRASQCNHIRLSSSHPFLR